MYKEGAVYPFMTWSPKSYGIISTLLKVILSLARFKGMGVIISLDGTVSGSYCKGTCEIEVTVVTFVCLFVC